MSSLFDQAIAVGRQLEGSDQRLTALKAEIAQTEDTLKVRQQELSKLERDSAQRLKEEQTTWENAKREQEASLTQRETDVAAKEAALKTFPDQAKALTDREAQVTIRETEATTQWQRAKQAELDWQERDNELDAKADAINQLKPSSN